MFHLDDEKEEGLNIVLIKRDENHKIADLLRQNGHHVVECTDEKEAVELFQVGDFHLILNGNSVLEKVLRKIKFIKE